MGGAGTSARGTSGAAGDTGGTGGTSVGADERRGSRLSRTKSLNVYDRSLSKMSVANTRQRSVDSSVVMGVAGAGAAVGGASGGGATGLKKVPTGHPKPRKFNKIALERELKQRNKNIAANYPDSGIGMAGDGAMSLKSDPSFRSAFTRTGRTQRD